MHREDIFGCLFVLVVVIVVGLGCCWLIMADNQATENRQAEEQQTCQDFSKIMAEKLEDEVIGADVEYSIGKNKCIVIFSETGQKIYTLETAKATVEQNQ